MSLELNDSIKMMFESTDDDYMDKDIDDLVQICKSNENNTNYNKAFAAIYCKVSKMIYSAYKKYKNIITEFDAISILNISIYEAIKNYQFSRCKFTSFLYVHYKRALITEFIRVNRQKTKLNNNCYDIASIDNSKKYSYEGKIDLRLSIKIDNKLNKLQKKVFSMLLTGMTMEQIRKELGISIEKLRAIKLSLLEFKDNYIQ